jgi:hypothetical protein
MSCLESANCNFGSLSSLSLAIWFLQSAMALNNSFFRPSDLLSILVLFSHYVINYHEELLSCSSTLFRVFFLLVLVLISRVPEDIISISLAFLFESGLGLRSLPSL